MTINMGGAAWPVGLPAAGGALRSVDVMASARAETVLAPGRSTVMQPVDCRTADGRPILEGVEFRTSKVDWRPAVVSDERTYLSIPDAESGRHTPVQARHGGVVIDAGRLIVT